MKRIVDLVRAKRAERALARHEGWSREQLLAHQRARAEAIVRHAVERSPFYRARSGGSHALAHQPVLTKAELMEHYDSIVTDPRLRRDELLAHVESIDGDELHHGEFRVIATSGSSGLKGLFVYDRAGWVAVMSGFLRCSRITGTAPRLPRRQLVFVGPSGGGHMSSRMAAMVDNPLQPVHRLSATAPLPELVARLHEIRPGVLAGFPSMLALLAEEQLAGRLQVAPQIVGASSEMLTGAMRAVIREAWGIDPFDHYGITEAGILGVDCHEHAGIHVNEDLMVVEVVDRDGNPVPDGEVGEQMLVTSLDNRVQPTIRLAVADRVAFDPEPCACGRPHRRLRAVEGRADDVLELPGRDGRRVPVHPLQFAPVAQAREVREFQIVQRGQTVHVRVALRNGADREALAARLSGELRARLSTLGVADPQVGVEFCDGLERDPARMGKVQLVVADRSA
jgi:phenylacetate-coenzyme A ligase PaaK-like adenylate-forming protein